MSGKEYSKQAPVFNGINIAGRGLIEVFANPWINTNKNFSEGLTEFPELAIQLEAETHSVRLIPANISYWDETIDSLKRYETSSPGSSEKNALLLNTYGFVFVSIFFILPFIIALTISVVSLIPAWFISVNKLNKSNQAPWLKRRYKSTTWEVSDLNGGELNQNIKEKLQQKYPDCLFSFVKDPPKMDPPKMSYRQPLEVSDLANTTMLPNFFTKHPPLLNGKGIGARANLSEKLQSQVSNSKRTR